jgi:hypothetical protein
MLFLLGDSREGGQGVPFAWNMSCHHTQGGEAWVIFAGKFGSLCKQRAGIGQGSGICD